MQISSVNVDIIVKLIHGSVLEANPRSDFSISLQQYFLERSEPPVYFWKPIRSISLLHSSIIVVCQEQM